MGLVSFSKRGGLVMRTTFAAVPRAFDWQPGFKTQTYTAQPFPPVTWRQVHPSSQAAITWCEAVHLTWMTMTKSGVKPSSF
jgi:hypothetical protein